MNGDGSELTRLTNGQAHYESLAWSPTEQQIVFVSQPDRSNPDKSEIYVMNADGSGLTNLTNQPNWYKSPVWSPDGRQIAFESRRDGNWEIYVMDAGGSNLRNLTQHPAGDYHPAWSPACVPIASLPPAARPTSPPAPAPTPVLTRHPGWRSYPAMNYLQDMAFDSDDNLWAVGSGGVWDPTGSTYTRYTVYDGLGAGFVRSIAVAPDGALWVGTLGGISRYLPPD